jgi:hypothetical protein
MAPGADGMVALAVELYKHWYGLSNRFYPKPYGPRSLKAVLIIVNANGTTAYASPSCSLSPGGAATAADPCSWRHSSGSTLHEDLHTGQSADGRLATPGWESAGYHASAAWAGPTAVRGPVGALHPHPMPRSRVLEIVRPIRVAPVAPSSSAPTAATNADSSSHASEKQQQQHTYRFTLPHEIAGFCTLLLPQGSPAGMRATIRHGEAVDMGTGEQAVAPRVTRSARGRVDCNCFARKRLLIVNQSNRVQGCSSTSSARIPWVRTTGSTATTCRTSPGVTRQGWAHTTAPGDSWPSTATRLWPQPLAASVAPAVTPPSLLSWTAATTSRHSPPRSSFQPSVLSRSPTTGPYWQPRRSPRWMLPRWRASASALVSIGRVTWRWPAMAVAAVAV